MKTGKQKLTIEKTKDYTVCQNYNVFIMEGDTFSPRGLYLVHKEDSLDNPKQKFEIRSIELADKVEEMDEFDTLKIEAKVSKA